MKTNIIITKITIIFLLFELTVAPTLGLSIKDVETLNLQKQELSVMGGGANCAVIVCGRAGFVPEQCDIRMAQKAAGLFLENGYNVKNLIDSSKIEVEEAITEWIPANIGGNRKVFLFFVDHGLREGFCLGSEIIEHSELTYWVNEIENDYSICTILIAACHSGYFINGLSKNNRIIMTSSRRGVAWGSDFSYTILDELEAGKSYGEAWEQADGQASSMHAGQSPQIDDNGDGIGHGTSLTDNLPIGGDGNLALLTYPWFNPPDTPTIMTDSTSGLIPGEEYEYIINTADPDNDDVYYYIEWGDGNNRGSNSGWLGPHPSDEKVTITHIWALPGTYNIRVKAKDVYNAESSWCTLKVSTPKNRTYHSAFNNILVKILDNFPLLQQLLKL